MKKLISAAFAAFVAVAPGIPATAESSWVATGKSDDGVRQFVQKHNWQGRYRTYEVITIEPNNSETRIVIVADCESWRFGPRGNNDWHPALPGTMGEAQIRYVCS